MPLIKPQNDPRFQANNKGMSKEERKRYNEGRARYLKEQKQMAEERHKKFAKRYPHMASKPYRPL